jgi:hypothetical protein
MIPEFQDPHRRETFVYEYRLMYRVEADCVRILRVVHGRRLLANVHGSFEELHQDAYIAATPSEHPMEDAVAVAEKPTLSAKDEVRALLDRLPDTVTLEDIQYHLDVVIKVLESEADPGDDISDEEMRRQFAEWLAE